MNKLLKRFIYKIEPELIIKNSYYFDSDFYCRNYKINPKFAALHYLNDGYKLDYDPSIRFNGTFYQSKYLDIGDMNPLLHYEVYGMYEGRTVMAKPVGESLDKLLDTFIQKYEFINSEDVNINLLFTFLELEGAKIYAKPKNISIDDKYVLVLSHEMDLTGAPIALFNAVQYLKNSGYCPIIISPNDGFLSKNASLNDIPVIIYKDLYKDNILDNFYHLFDFIFINTLLYTKYIIKLNGTKNKVIWWLHESKSVYVDLNEITKYLPNKLCNNIHIYAVGDYAKARMHEIRPNYKIDDLYYFLPEKNDIAKNKNYQFGFEDSNKIIFAMVGTLEKRKGHEILLNSLEKIDKKFKDKIKIVLVGAKADLKIFNLIKNYKGDVELVYIEKIDRDLMPIFYSKIDCLICSSTDDPMPITVSEAWKYSIPVICSSAIGSASLIEKYGGGLVYENNDPIELANKINEFVLNKDKDICKQMISKGYEIYEKMFSEKAFNNRFNEIISNIHSNDTKKCDALVSIVVPTFNPGEDIKTLIENIKKQIDVNVEIIVVDSGSSDGTIEYLKEEKVKLIQISQKDFSHSYARNLGAENASGEYLLFTVQDACPSSEHFLIDLLQPLLKNEAVATISKQIPRSDCDLYGALSIYYNNKYCGYDIQDSIVSLPLDISNKDVMRKNAALDDVCCLIQKDVFDKYKYSGTFAEDIDLGIRLVKDGYSIARFSSVPIIHSHNKAPFYFSKRSLADYQLNNRNDYINNSINDRISSCITIYILILKLKDKLKSTFDMSYDLDLLFNNIQKEIDSIVSLLNEKNIDSNWINYEPYDKNLHSLMICLSKCLNSKIIGNTLFLLDYKLTTCNVLHEYLIENKISIEDITYEDCYAFINKAFANRMGYYLGDYLESDNVSEEVKESLNAVKV